MNTPKHNRKALRNLDTRNLTDDDFICYDIEAWYTCNEDCKNCIFNTTKGVISKQKDRIG